MMSENNLAPGANIDKIAHAAAATVMTLVVDPNPISRKGHAMAKIECVVIDALHEYRRALQAQPGQDVLVTALQSALECMVANCQGMDGRDYSFGAIAEARAALASVGAA